MYGTAFFHSACFLLNSAQLLAALVNVKQRQLSLSLANEQKLVGASRRPPPAAPPPNAWIVL